MAKCGYNNEVKENEMSRACSTDGSEENAYGVLIGKPEGKYLVSMS
jgi:hypothetical protein